MFTLTAAAAARIRQAAVEGGMAELALRVAARRENDGSITYGMGFDEPGEGEQPSLQSVLDFVELSPGEFNFIFVPQATAARGKSGCGSCSSGGCATC